MADDPGLPTPPPAMEASVGDTLPAIGRRAFLGALVAWALAPAKPTAAAAEVREASYAVRTSLLWGLLRFEVNGFINEAMDRQEGRYEVRVAGRGSEMTSEIESRGALLDGRWAPLRFHDHFIVYGRESNLEITYDHARRAADYHGRSETFLLGRLRSTDDVVTLPPATHVDDVISAALNFADDRWPAEPDGTLVTHVVRRRRTPDEGVDDVARAYRAEVVPFVLNFAPDPNSARLEATFDLTKFTSWGLEKEPARIVFGPDRRPEGITASLILGTSLTVRITPRSP
jgi:hypothetical protein